MAGYNAAANFHCTQKHYKWREYKNSAKNREFGRLEWINADMELKYLYEC